MSKSLSTQFWSRGNDLKPLKHCQRYIQLWRKPGPIRDEYQFWIDQVDEWAASNNQRRRARHGPPGSGLLWRNSKFYRAMPDGSYEPLDVNYFLPFLQLPGLKIF